jgi:hypothetical protein
MKSRMKLALAMLAGLPLAGVAQEHQLNCIKDVTYSQEFLAKYPNAPAACQEVVVANGQKWVRFNAKTKDAAARGEVTIDVMNSYGTPVATLTFAFTPDAQVTVGGKPVMASSLKGGEEITIWMPENRFGFYSQAGAPENQKFRLVSRETSQKR